MIYLNINYIFHLFLQSKHRILIQFVFILFVYMTFYGYNYVLCMNDQKFIQETIRPFIGQQETIEALQAKKQELMLENLRLQTEHNSLYASSIVDQLDIVNLELDNERLRLKIKELKHKLYSR